MKNSSNILDRFLDRLFANKEQVAVAKFESMEPRLMLSGSVADNPYEAASDAESEDVYGTKKADEYIGGADADEYHGGNGDDTIKGRAGDDELYGDKGDDVIIGNTGNDTLYGGDGDDLLLGRKDNDILNGDKGDDTLKGGGGDDKLYGGDGDDVIRGARGNDLLSGEKGDDWMRAGIGADDMMIGGQGGDYFVFGYNLVKDNPDISDASYNGDDYISGNQTTIMDFTSGVDKIVIQNGLIKNQLIEDGVEEPTWKDVRNFDFDDLMIDYDDGDAVISFISGDVQNQIVVKGVGEGGLTADDFIIGGKTSAKHFVAKTGVYLDR